jgi:hypothetical protein
VYLKLEILANFAGYFDPQNTSIIPTGRQAVYSLAADLHPSRRFLKSHPQKQFRNLKDHAKK